MEALEKKVLRFLLKNFHFSRAGQSNFKEIEKLEDQAIATYVHYICVKLQIERPSSL